MGGGDDKGNAIASASRNSGISSSNCESNNGDQLASFDDLFAQYLENFKEKLLYGHEVLKLQIQNSGPPSGASAVDQIIHALSIGITVRFFSL